MEQRGADVRVAMVIERYLPIWGGAENQLHQLIPRLNAKNCRITVVTRRWRQSLLPQEKLDQVSVVRLGISGTGKLSTAWFVIALMSYIIRHRGQIDILHSHGAANLGALCALLARSLGMKNVCKIATAGKISALSRSNFGKLILLFLKKSDAIVVMTDEIKKEVETLGAMQVNLIEIPNGVDPDRFSVADSKERARFRRDLGIRESAKLVLFCGRLVQRKGLDVLLGAWSTVVAKVPEAYLLILGSGTNQPDSVENEMKRYVREQQLPQVIFLGETPHPEYFLAAVDCFSFPSRKEGFPNALLEAMAASLPVVAANIGGVRPLVKDGVTGMLFIPEDQGHCAQKLVTVLTDQQLAEKIGKAGQNFVTEYFSFETVSQQYGALYDEIRCGPSKRTCR